MAESTSAAGAVGGEICPICRTVFAPLAFVKNGYPFHRCAVCEVAFRRRSHAEVDLASLYSAEYFTKGGAGYRDYNGDERVHRKQARKYLQKLSRLGIPPGSLIDIGCASGFFLDEARRRGWQVHGCELSEYAQRHAQRDLGLDVARSDFLDPRYSPPPESVDVVTMFNVLEHLPDPTAVAAKLFRLLRPGGHVVLETWDPQSLFARILGPHWPTYAPPTVLHCFTRRTLARLFEFRQWSLVTYRFATKWISFEHGLSILEYEARNVPVIATALRAARRSRIGRVMVPYCLGDLAFAVLRKKPHRDLPSTLAS